MLFQTVDVLIFLRNKFFAFVGFKFFFLRAHSNEKVVIEASSTFHRSFIEFFVVKHEFFDDATNFSMKDTFRNIFQKFKLIKTSCHKKESTTFHRKIRAWPRKFRWNVNEASMTTFSMLCVNGPLHSENLEVTIGYLFSVFLQRKICLDFGNFFCVLAIAANLMRRQERKRRDWLIGGGEKYNKLFGFSLSSQCLQDKFLYP